MTKLQFALLAGTIALAGCQSKGLDTEKDGWDSTSVEETAPASTQASNSNTPAPASDDNSIVLKGSDFKQEGTTNTLNSEGTILRVGHYFAASTPFETKTTVTKVITELEGQNVDGAVPLIGFQINTTAGKYNAIKLPERPIDGPQTLTDTIDLGPGQYKATIYYYKDTVGEKRPHITLKQMKIE